MNIYVINIGNIEESFPKIVYHGSLNRKLFESNHIYKKVSQRLLSEPSDKHYDVVNTLIYVKDDIRMIKKYFDISYIELIIEYNRNMVINELLK